MSSENHRAVTLDRPRTRSTGVEQLLVKAAVHLLEEEGPEGVSVRRVAAAAGVAPMGVYNHFDGKNGLIDAVFQMGFAALTQEMAEVAAIADSQDALREGFRRYRTLALSHPRTYGLMFLGTVQGFEPSDAAKTAAADSFDALVSTVRRAMDDRVLADADAASVAQVLWAACHGAVALEITGICLVADMSESYDDLVDALLRGLSPPTGRAGSAPRGSRPARAR